MRIGIDLHTLTDFMQGSRTYVYNLTRSLLDIDRENEYYLYFPRNLMTEAESGFQQDNVQYKIISPSKRSIRLSISFPVKLAMHRVDLFLCQYMGPLFARCPYIVTIHDIIHERYPEFYPKNLRVLMKLFYPLSARRAARILTGSEYSKREIRDIFKIPEERIKVIPYGVSDDFRLVDDIDGINRVKKKYGIDGNYILFVGRLEPRKNIKGLIEAYILLKNQYNIKQQLVIVGMKDVLFRDFDIRGENIEGNVIFTGGVAGGSRIYLQWR